MKRLVLGLLMGVLLAGTAGATDLPAEGAFVQAAANSTAASESDVSVATASEVQRDVLQGDGLRVEVPGEAAVGQALGREIKRGKVSWYGKRFHGRRTASGEKFDMYALTAAHPSLPFGTRLRVRHLESGREVVVRINDRGPHVGGRILDLSQAAAQALGMIQAGETQVALVED